MKRSRRVVLTLMGSAATSAVSMGFASGRPACGAGLEPVRASNGKSHCRAARGGFGSAPRQLGGRDPGYFGGS